MQEKEKRDMLVAELKKKGWDRVCPKRRECAVYYHGAREA